MTGKKRSFAGECVPPVHKAAFLFFSTLLAASLAPAADVCVSTDGPISSPHSALSEVRRMRAAGLIASNATATVSFAPGVYRLESTLSLGAADSHVSFEGSPKGRVVFSGGRRIGPFAAGPGGVWRAKVPDGLVFEQLYVNGRRAQIAREPNDGWHYILKEYGEYRNPVSGKLENLALRMLKTDPKMVKMLEGLDAEELKSAMVHVWWSWDTEWRRPVHADAAKGEILLGAPLARSVFYWSGHCTRVNLENCRAALDAPGEWFLDRRRGEVLYVPRPGERPEDAVAVAPVLKNLVVLSDVDGVKFRNITFAHNAWIMPANGFYEYQSAAYADAAVVSVYSRDVEFASCTFEHTANYGIWLGAGSSDCRVAHSHLHDLGAGGVRVGPYGARVRGAVSAPENCARRVRVDDNIIHDGGHVNPAGTGVFITRMRDSVVTHNEICDFFYSGVACGFSWSYRNQQNFDNTISWNHIHHLGKGHLSDMGFIYTLGDSRGTVVAGNHGHDILSYGYTGSGGAGLYPDEGSVGILWTSNLIHHTRTSCLSQHYGRDNRFINNIFAFPSKPDAAAGRRARPENHVSLVVSNNVFMWSKGLCGWRSSQSDRPARVDDLVFGRNLWWSIDGVTSTDFNRLPFAEWQRQGGGFDLGSKVADPKFVDFRRGDWRLRKDSPALALGFVPWDYSFAGVRKGDKAWRKKAASIRCGAFRVPEEPPKNPEVKSFSTSFEGFAVGESPEGALGAWTFSPNAGVKRVTDRDHRKGAKCVEMVDRPGLSQGFEPHLFKKFKVVGEEFAIRYSFKSDAAARFAVELRDNNNPKAKNGVYSTGGTLMVEGGALKLTARVNENGRLVGRELRFGNYAPGKWFDVVITISSPGNTDPTWAVSVTSEDGNREEFRELYFHASDCRMPNWIGFISWATADTVTLLDDFGYESK